MALQLSANFQWEADGKKMAFVTVTHDEVTSTFTAASIGFDYILDFIASPTKLASAAANTSIAARYENISILGDARNMVQFDLPPKVGSTTRLMIVGW